jgi:iron-sulfur cluster repair protein YtfE (RIC family)
MNAMEKTKGHEHAMGNDGYIEASLHPLRGRHRELRPHLENLLEFADAVGDIPLAELRRRLDEVYTFLSGALIPHAYAENQVIFPLVAKILGSLEPTSLLDRDHAEIRSLTEELARIRQKLSGPRMRSVDAKELRRTLYGLSVLLRVHLEQEGIYLALLEANLAPEELRGAFDALADAESKAQMQAG